MVWHLTLLVTWLSLASAALGGPWPRGEGQTFVSLSSTLMTPQDAIGGDLAVFHALYIERGWRRDLTFGLDAGMDSDNNYSAFAFARAPVFVRDGPHRFALRLGAGMTETGGQQDALVMAGAAWGRGFDTPIGGGWAVLDLQVHQRLNAGETILKADATVGLRPTDRLKVILQLQAGDYPGADPLLKFAPSVTWEVMDGRHIEIGALVGITGDDQLGLKLGSWIEF